MSKSNANNYVQNNWQSYGSQYKPVKTYYMNTNAFQIPQNIKPSYYGNKYESKHVLSGGEASGSVWVNPSYDVATEDPGISWVL
jgi:hypothetical protein